MPPSRPALRAGTSEAGVAKQTLQTGDSLLLYTDGVVEAQTPEGDDFGLERLTDQLEREAASGQRAQELLRRLVRSVLDHRSTELRDDATLLITQWLSAPEQTRFLARCLSNACFPASGRGQTPGPKLPFGKASISSDPAA